MNHRPDKPLDFRQPEHRVFPPAGDTEWAFTMENFRMWNICGRNADHLKDANVLELGCNGGRMSYAALYYGAKALVGVDLYAAHVAMCERAVPSGIFKQGDIRDHLSEPQGADIVICAGVLYHLDEHERIFDGLALQLDTGAKMIIGDTAVRQEADSLRVTEFTDPAKWHTCIWPHQSTLISECKKRGLTLTFHEWDESVYSAPQPNYGHHRKLFTITH